MTSNDAGTDTGSLLDAHVRGYAQAVRLHLADLGPDVVEDLTDGLEANLADALVEASAAGARTAEDDVVLDLGTHFGPAAAYAAELRAAAGLPPAGPPSRRERAGMRASVMAAVRAVAARWRERWRPVTSTPQWAALRGLARDLRPVWWVARGWVVGSWLNAFFDNRRLLLVPMEAGDAVLLLLAVLVSVQWGRGRWLPWTWVPRAVLAVSVLALLMTPTLVGSTREGVLYGTVGPSGGGSYQQGYDDAMQTEYASIGGVPGDDGVWVDGMQVSNLFAYDANGDPIKDVQLFDDRGRPVRTVPQGAEENVWAVPDVAGSWYFRPATATDGRERWNVYPLRAVPEAGMAYPEDGGPMAPQVGVQPEAMPWPFLKAPTAVATDARPDDGSADGEKEPKSTAPTEVPTEAPASGVAPQRGGTVLEAGAVG